MRRGQFGPPPVPLVRTTQPAKESQDFAFSNQDAEFRRSFDMPAPSNLEERIHRLEAQVLGNRNLKYLEATMKSMGQHITSLEDLIIHRDDKVKALEAELAILRERPAAKLPQYDLELMSREIVRLGKVFLSFQEGFGNLHSQILSQVEERMENMEIRVSKALESRNTSEHEEKVDFVESQLGRLEYKLSERMHDKFDAVFSRMSEIDEVLRNETSDLRNEVARDLSLLKEGIEISMKNHDVRMQDVVDGLIKTSSQDNMIISELRNELEARFQAFDDELHQEGQIRMDAVRRCHNDLTDQIESALLRSGSTLAATAGTGEEGQREKLLELEEIVRAEVRARMRHETKAREHVENTAKMLEEQINQLNMSTKSRLDGAETQMKAQTVSIVQKTSEECKALENKLEEYAEARQLANSAALERVSICEAKLAKRAAFHEMDIVNLKTNLEKAFDEMRTGFKTIKKEVVSEKKNLETTFQNHVSWAKTAMDELQESTRKFAENKSKRISQDLSRLQQNFNLKVAAFQNNLSNLSKQTDCAVHDHKVRITDLEAFQVSSSCLKDIIGKLEERNRCSREQQLQRAFENNLKEETNRLSADLNHRVGLQNEILREKEGSIDRILQTTLRNFTEEMKTVNEALASEQSTRMDVVSKCRAEIKHLEVELKKQLGEEVEKLLGKINAVEVSTVVNTVLDDIDEDEFALKN